MVDCTDKFFSQSVADLLDEKYSSCFVCCSICVTIVRCHLPFLKFFDNLILFRLILWVSGVIFILTSLCLMSP